VQGSNNDIPAPNNTLPTIITKFKLQGLDIVDLVALLGTCLAIANKLIFSRF
jgi:peroxidase